MMHRPSPPMIQPPTVLECGHGRTLSRVVCASMHMCVTTMPTMCHYDACPQQVVRNGRVVPSPLARAPLLQ
eukprot:1093068-Pyramimonas_sp.AAC.2